jgi:high-affinity nickel-transport protein
MIEMMLDGSPANSALAVIALGFFLGMRHAVDVDHVIAVTTIVSRQRGRRQAAATGLLWGLGHTITVVAVGGVLILFNLMIPVRVELGLELSVSVMLVVLGLMTLAGVLQPRPASMAAHQSHVLHSHPHSHGDYIHSHPHGHDPESHPHRPDRTPVAFLDRMLGGLSLYGWVRPIAVGVVHGLAGSAAVTLLVLAAIREPLWAIVYLVVFGVGTMGGMMLVTMAMASAFQYADRGSARLTRAFGLASGVVSVAFGLSLAYQISFAAAP